MMLSKKGGSNASERKGTSRNVKRIAADAYVEKDQQVIKLIVCGLDESFDAETCQRACMMGLCRNKDLCREDEYRILDSHNAL